MISLLDRSTRGARAFFLAATVLAGSAVLLPGATELPLPADHAVRMTRGLKRFHDDIAPLLKEQCVRCHGGEKTKGEFDLTTRETLLRGGSDGPVVRPFAAASSRLLRLIQHAEEPSMPEKGPKLSEAAIAKMAAWIDDGAPYDQPLIEGRRPARDASTISDEDRRWWAFQPLARVSPPRGKSASTAARDTHPIDAFLEAAAAEKKVRASPPADRRTLIRRAYLDLLGLPPPPEEVEAFVRNDSPTAWNELVDRLLASPHYGERWARHWLDVARFAESSGFEHDYDREGAFHYRDFVIKALNADLAYDEFVHWQLAGDEFAPDNPLALTATGFLGAGVFPTQITANEVERTRYDALDDMLSTTGSAFLGLTVGCARCHDHKYDPIPSRDYYRMLSTFTTTVRSVIDLDLDPAQTRKRVDEWEAARAPLLAEATRYETSLETPFAQWLQAGARRTNEASWTLLDVTRIVSKGGTTFKRLDDGSHLAEGKNAEQDEYTLVATTEENRLTGLRLDALAHPSMKKGGPGRADNGNFALSRIRVFTTPKQGGGATQEVALARAMADFEQNNHHLSAASALDDQPNTGWAVDPQFGKDHSAVFVFREPVEQARELVWVVKLEFRVNTRHALGRPRLAASSATEPTLQGDVVPPAIAATLARIQRTGGASETLSAAERTSLFDWWKQRDAGWRERRSRIEAQARQKPDGRTRVLICGEGRPPLRMHTQGADFFEQTHFLKRGSTELKNGVATPGFLQVLTRAEDPDRRWKWQPPEGAKVSGRRRALAQWITDAEAGAGPLAARVMVNRVWQHHFGRGLVPTPNDFGRTGTAPSQPALLDWLAGEFIRGGWKLKSLHRLMLTSAAYRQSTQPNPKAEALDPANDLFARRLPRRLEGEVIRDSMLATSGALDPTLFGPGTKDERSRRRSIYFTIKRSELIGSMVAFDQPEPLVSQGQRPTTTVAPQALFVLNGPQVRDWAGALARRTATESTPGPAPDLSTSERLRRAYGLTLGRAPTRSEQREATSFIDGQSQSYRAEGRAEVEAQSLAWTDFCQVLLGLNEFAYEF